MAGSDAIVVVEDWISEHYFTSDARNESFQARVLKRRKSWDDAADGPATPRTHFIKQRAALGASIAALTGTDDEDLATARDDAAVALYDSLRELFGYETGEFLVSGHDGVRAYNTAGVTAAAPLIIVEATPVAAHEELFDKGVRTLLRPYPLDDTEFTSMPRLVSHLFLSETAPKFALILAGRWALVAEATRWAEGRYLAVNLQAVCERNDTVRGGEVDRALTCLAAESLAPDADGAVWWSTVLQDSVQHTIGVSKDLREGVRSSIEIIANEVVTRRAAQGLPPLPQEQAQPLAKQSLRFLYRILFLLYAEASPELAVLPVEAPEYEAGYSLTRLRELTLVEITDPKSQHGTHLYDSLGLLFRLVDRGHVAPRVTGEDGRESTDGLDFQPLRADLFKSDAIALIDEVKLGNAAMQQVLKLLLLSKESGVRDRGFISYVELGINQLGAVYEGLMSYTGFFAETDLYEVAKNGDSSKGSWVVPIERAQGIAASDFVRVRDEVSQDDKPVVHRSGSFVFRLSGRERQQSASYYTPEVLTRFTVGQALEELLDQDGHTTTAEEILGLTICEPALGSGAFAIEAVRQLAAEYLSRRQQELGETIPPEDYPLALQRVKASIALHQVYGVDLNATAVEFAEITLWLDTMAAGLQAPWFGLHLRRGNSLIGARRAVYTRDQVNSKAWLDTPPTDVPLTDIAQRVADDDPRQTEAGGRIPHWLLPAKGWGATADSSEAKQLAPERTQRVRDWRKSVIGRPTKTQTDALIEIGHQAEELWRMAYRRMLVAEQQSRRSIPLWGRDVRPDPIVVSREQIEASLADENGAFRRLRRLMDAWCALWFWPLTGDEVAPPTLAQWIDACQQLLGKDVKARRAAVYGATILAPDDVWQALADQEDLAIKGAGAKPVSEILTAHPWLGVCERTAQDQGFFHWQLDFATVFGRGGFDLQIGNPPWVRPRGDVDALLAEGDPWWKLTNKPSEDERDARVPATLTIPGVREAVLAGVGDVVALAAYVGDSTCYPLLSGLQPDLYRCFMSQVWSNSSTGGRSALIHYETHFTDERAGLFRSEQYLRLRRHWEFINELRLFADIEDHKHYGVSVWGEPHEVDFLNGSCLYHPETVIRSLHHDGSGPEPGFKHEGTWDLRPHQSRIQMVTDEALSVWHEVLEDPSTPLRQTRMLYTVNRTVSHVLAEVGKAGRIGGSRLSFSRGWDESIDRKKGYFVQKWGTPASWADVILQGPHLHVNNPMYKVPNPTMLHNQDWSPVDLETLAEDAIPATSYKPAGDRARYDRDYTHWDGMPARGYYRIAWRAMAANTGERTLIPALIPPGAAHPNGVFCVGGGDDPDLARILGTVSSLISDFAVRAAPKSGIYQGVFNRLPIPPSGHPLEASLKLRTLRLNCLTAEYAPFWAKSWLDAYADDGWAIDTHHEKAIRLGQVTNDWNPNAPLRVDLDRRNAQVEIDAIVAIMLGITADELCTVYRTQFAVLYGYDHDVYFFDANGRLVPNAVLTVWRRKGEAITRAERTATNASGNTYVYELPYRTFDREADMRTAYAEFERRLAERS